MLGFGGFRRNVLGNRVQGGDLVSLLLRCLQLAQPQAPFNLVQSLVLVHENLSVVLLERRRRFRDGTLRLSLLGFERVIFDPLLDGLVSRDERLVVEVDHELVLANHLELGVLYHLSDLPEVGFSPLASLDDRLLE